MTAHQHPEALRAKMAEFPTHALQEAARRLVSNGRLDDIERQVADWIDAELQRRMMAGEYVDFLGELERLVSHAA